MPDSSGIEPSLSDVSAEDAKLLVLARSAAARGGGSGASVRDAMGRTYVSGPVALRTLTLSAVQAAVAAAVASGAGTVEAVAVVGAVVTPADDDLLTELGSPTVHTG